jgi:uncharacterized protein involved in exopolysaccharide biosynthesis
MIKPIIEKDNFFIGSIFSFISFKRKSILRFSLVGMFLYILYFLFLKGPNFVGKVSFYTNYSQKPQSSIMSFLPSSLGDFSSSDLKFSISNYISSDKFLQDIVSKQYLINNENITLVELWGSGYSRIFSINPMKIIESSDRNILFNNKLSKEEKKMQFAKEQLAERISFSQDRKTSLTTISVEVSNHDNLAESVINEIYHSILNYSNEVNSIKAKEKMQFISGRLEEIKNSLEKSENEMLVFMENNKVLTSPNLKLKKDRIQRDITLFNQLYLSLSDQLELAKIDEKDDTSSIFLLDMPQVSPYQTGRGLFNGSLTVFCLFFVFSTCYNIFLYRKKLFQI